MPDDGHRRAGLEDGRVAPGEQSTAGAPGSPTSAVRVGRVLRDQEHCHPGRRVAAPPPRRGRPGGRRRRTGRAGVAPGAPRPDAGPGPTGLPSPSSRRASRTGVIPGRPARAAATARRRSAVTAGSSAEEELPPAPQQQRLAGRGRPRSSAVPPSRSARVRASRRTRCSPRALRRPGPELDARAGSAASPVERRHLVDQRPGQDGRSPSPAAGRPGSRAAATRSATAAVDSPGTGPRSGRPRRGGRPGRPGRTGRAGGPRAAGHTAPWPPVTPARVRGHRPRRTGTGSWPPPAGTGPGRWWTRGPG